MNQKQVNSNSINDSSRCEHRFINGTRCRLLVPNAESLFCRNHAQLPEHDHAPVNLSATLTAGLTEFKSAVPINEFLSRLLHLQAEDRIPPRRAAVMAYTCNLILRTLPAIEHELHPEDDITHVDFGDLPRPHYYDRVPPSHPVMDCLSPSSQVPNSKEPL
jgi:hypothetical protein